ncbi:MAG: LysE family translocator [Actinomycetota bacterium]|nr:LysE family translocator [Actinomycetota bacterium]
MVDNVAAFLVVAAVVIVTPGPDTALTIRNTLLGGRRGGIFTAVGVSAGQAAWTVATSAGVVALLVASETIFRAVRLVGAAYLILLGLQALSGAVRSRPVRRASAEPAAAGLRPPVALCQGLLSNLTNPKMAAFFPALLPQFAPEGGPTFLILLLLGLTFSLMTLVWLTGYAFAVAKAGDFLRRPQARRLLEALTGAVLIALGLRLATEKR